MSECKKKTEESLGLCDGPTVYVLCASRSEHFIVIVRLVTLHLIIPTLGHGLDRIAAGVCVPNGARRHWSQ